jgi:hypothetical protein
MPRTTKAQFELEGRLQAAFESGFNHFREDPEADMATVHQKASGIYGDSKDEALAYAEGYRIARLKHDDYLKEKGSQSGLSGSQNRKVRSHD